MTFSLGTQSLFLKNESRSSNHSLEPKFQSRVSRIYRLLFRKMERTARKIAGLVRSVGTNVRSQSIVWAAEFRSQTDGWGTEYFRIQSLLSWLFKLFRTPHIGLAPKLSIPHNGLAPEICAHTSEQFRNFYDFGASLIFFRVLPLEIVSPHLIQNLRSSIINFRLRASSLELVSSTFVYQKYHVRPLSLDPRNFNSDDWDIHLLLVTSSNILLHLELVLSYHNYII